MTADPVLAVDVGGTKILTALVDGARVVEKRRVETRPASGAEGWLDAIATAAADWSGRYRRAGVAVTGNIRDGCWFAMNPSVLPVPDGFPLVERLSARLGVPVIAANDAQAAAWGEYRHGEARGRDLVFLTISTGIGGGLVIGGRLATGRGGLAGHIGQVPVAQGGREVRLEDLASGSALARLAAAAGAGADPAALTALALAGDTMAGTLLDAVVAPLALALRGLQFTLDPDVFVIGGGLGLAPGYLDRLRAALSALPASLRPDVRAAALGANAGVVGIADLVTMHNESAPEVEP